MNNQKLSPIIELQRNLINELSNISEFDESNIDTLIYNMCKTIIDSIQDNIKTDASSIWLRSLKTETGDAVMYAGSGYHQEFVRQAVPIFSDSEEYTQNSLFKNKEIGLTSWVISKGVSVLVPSNMYPEIQQHPFWRGKFDKDQYKFSKLEIEAFLAVPIRRKDGFVIGAIKCERVKNNVDVKHFEIHERVLLEAYARVVAKCKMYYNCIMEGHEKRYYWKGDFVRNDIDKVIKAWTHELLMDAFNFEDNTDNYLVEAAKIIQCATHSDSCAIFLIDKENKTITQRGGSGYQELRKVVRSYPIPEKHSIECMYQASGVCDPSLCKPKDEDKKVGLTAWIAVSEMAFIAKNRSKLLSHCHHKGKYDPLNFDSDYVCGAFIGFPLRFGGKVIGVLKIEKQTRRNSDQENNLFDDIIVNRAQVISDELSYIISKIDDVNTKRMEVYKKSDSVIAAILQAGQNVNQLIKTVVAQTKDLFNARACALYLKVGNKLVQPEWAAIGWNKSFTESHQYDIVSESSIRPDLVSLKEIEELSNEQYLKITKELKENDDILFFKNCYGKDDTIATKYCLNKSISNDETDLIKLQTLLKKIKFNRIGLTVWIAVKKEKFIARSFEELRAHPHHLGTFDADNFKNDDKCESFMGIPLVGIDNEVLGVLKVETKMKPMKDRNTNEFDFFSAQDEFLFELIARVTAIAIVNARRFEEEHLFMQLVKEKDVNKIFKMLNDFIKGRSDAREKLLEISAIFSTIDVAKVKLIESFVALIDTTDLPDRIGKIKNLLQPPLFENLNIIENLLRTKSIDEISKISIEKPLNPPDFTNNYDVYRAPEILDNELFRNVGKKINNYINEKSKKAELFSAIDDLIKQQKKINGFIFGVEGIVFKVVIDQLIDLIKNKAKEYKKINSPYLVGPALLGASKLFFGRESVFNEINTNLGQRAILLSGQGRIGKTSLVNQLKTERIKNEFSDTVKAPIFPIYIDCQNESAKKVAGFAFNISEAIFNEFQSHEYKVPAPDRKLFEEDPNMGIVSYFRGIYEYTKEDNIQIIYIFDEYEELYYIDAGHSNSTFKFYTRLRNIIDTCKNAVFLFVGRSCSQEVPSDFYKVLNSYCTSINVGLLENRAANELIINPVREDGVKYEEDAINEILKETCNHPLLIQSICNKCIVKLNEMKHNTIITKEMVREQINLIIEDKGVLEDLLTDTEGKHPEYATEIFSLFKNSDIVSETVFQRKFKNSVEIMNKLDLFCQKFILEKVFLRNNEPAYKIMIPMFNTFIKKRIR